MKMTPMFLVPIDMRDKLYATLNTYEKVQVDYLNAEKEIVSPIGPTTVPISAEPKNKKRKQKAPTTMNLKVVESYPNLLTGK